MGAEQNCLTLEYRILCDEVDVEERGSELYYGFSVMNNGSVINQYRVISRDKLCVEDFVKRLIVGKAELCHIEYMIDDWLFDLKI